MVNSSFQNDMDTELESMLSKQETRIKVFGCGGGGNNTINRISQIGIKGIQTIAINTDAQDLLYAKADKKILIGKDLTKGRGAGSKPEIGEQAAIESQEEIKTAAMSSDLVFITCGLGGGTGTGSVPILAQESKKLGALTIGVVTMPFKMEGNSRYENAVIGLEKLKKNVDTLIVIPNDKLLELAPDLPLKTAFKVADEILTNSVKGIAELITKTGLVNLDFADVKTVMGEAGVALIGVGESNTKDRSIDAVQKAIENPLLDVNIEGAKGALVNVAGGEDMTLNEARQVVENISEKLSKDAKLIWGAQIDADLEGILKVMIVVTGVDSGQIIGLSKIKEQKDEANNELGIKFLG